jgi:hypothetical protein
MPEIQTPSAATLAKHGLTEELWREMLERQNGQCALCAPGHLPPSLKLNIDHQHVRHYGGKDWSMPAEQKRKYHRGLLCYWHNSNAMARGASIEMFERGAQYLRDYEARRDA